MNLINRTVVLSFVLICGVFKLKVLARQDSDRFGHDPNWVYQNVRSEQFNRLNVPLYQSSERIERSEESADLNESFIHEDPEDPDLGTDSGPDAEIEPEIDECPICYLRREEAKRVRLEYIKRTILDRLGMEQPPNISANTVLPKNADLARFMSEYFSEGSNMAHMQNDQPQSGLDPPGATPSSRLEKMILFPKKPPPHWNVNENTSYAFTFSQKLYNYDVYDASLHIHILGRRVHHTSTAYYVLVKRVLEPPNGSLSLKIKTVFKKKVQLRPTKGHWVTLNLTDLVQEWFDYPEEHNVVQLSLVDAEDNVHDELLDTNTDSSYHKRPFLMANITEKRHSRLRRSAASALTCSERSPVTSCCKYPMVVDFEALKWDFILAPRSYEANVCQGVCPRMHMLQGGHAYFVSAINSSPGLCCSPKRQSELQLLLYDQDDNIQLMTIANVIIESCHCA